MKMGELLTKNKKEEIIELENHKYYLDRYVDEGTFGMVYLVKDINNDKKYALKILKESESSQTNQFLNEIKILKILSNPNNMNYTTKLYNSDVIKLKNFNSAQIAFVIDYAENGDLLLYVANSNSGLEERYAKYIFKKILEGINFMHKHNVCHFDIKVENILLDEDYKPLITDFGLSMKFENLDRNNKDCYGEIGTKYAECPQMFENEMYSGIEADIFSLGVLLLAMVTKKAFDKAFENEDYDYIKNKNYEKFWEKYGKLKGKILSEQCKELYQKMVAYDPSERPDIDDILKDPWLHEINCLDADFIKDYKKYMSELRNKIDNANETVNAKENQIIKYKTKAFDLDTMTQYFDSDMKPKNLFKEEPYFKYFLKIKGFIIPFEFMNLLGNFINKKYKNKDCYVDGDKTDLILKITWEKDDKVECKMEITLFKFDDNEYFIEFRRKESSLKEFYEYFLEIKTIIKNILE